MSARSGVGTAAASVRRFQPAGCTVPGLSCRSAGLCGFRAAKKDQAKWQMPKKETASMKQTKGHSAASADTAAQTQTSSPVNRETNGIVTIMVRAKPGSKHSSVTDVSAEVVGISVAAPPTDGEANAELIRYLADTLDLKKSRISLAKGARSRDKLIRVESSLSPEEVLARLRRAEG